MTARDALSPKHRKFLDEYCRDRNGAAAVRRSGYSERRAKVTAAELLARDDIKAALAEEDAATSEKVGIEVGEIVAALRTVLRANMLDYMAIGQDGQPYTDFSALTREQAGVIQEVHVETTQQRLEGGGDPVEVRKVRFKLYDKLAAADKLMRHLGGYVDRVEHTGRGGGPIEVRGVHDLTDEQLAAIASAGSSRTAPAPEGEGKPARLRKRRSNPGKAG